MFKSISFSRADIWFSLVCLLMISFPWNERINSVFILLLSALWLFDKNLMRKIRLLSQHWKLILPFWIFVLLHILFLPKSIHLPDALQTIEVKLTLLILPVIFSTENYLNKNNKKKMMMLFCYSCFLSALYCVIAYLIHFYPTLQWSMIFHRMYFSEYIMHPGYYSNFFVIAVIYLLLSLFEYRQSTVYYKVISISLIILFIAILFILVSKTAIILLMLFSIYLIWKLLNRLKQKYMKYLLFAIMAAVTIFVFSAVPSVRKRITDTKLNLTATDSTIKFENSTGSRIAAWGLEWELIQANWLWGYGTGNANVLLQKKFEDGNYADLLKYQMHTHNQILHTWIDLGIIGIISLLLLFSICLLHFYKRKTETGFWTVLLLLLYCLTDDALEIQIIIVFCSFMICILLFEKQNEYRLTTAVR